MRGFRFAYHGTRQCRLPRLLWSMFNLGFFSKAGYAKWLHNIMSQGNKTQWDKRSLAVVNSLWRKHALKNVWKPEREWTIEKKHTKVGSSRDRFSSAQSRLNKFSSGEPLFTDWWMIFCCHVISLIFVPLLIDDYQHQRRMVIHYPFLVAISREGLAAINVFTLSPIAKRNYDLRRTLEPLEAEISNINSSTQRIKRIRWHGHYTHAFKY